MADRPRIYSKITAVKGLMAGSGRLNQQASRRDQWNKGRNFRGRLRVVGRATDTVSPPGRRRVTTRKRRYARFAAAVLAAATLIGVAAPASAEGFFESIFGRVRRHSLPPQASPFADPFGLFGPERRPSHDVSGPATGYCVRACDGRFFPVQRSANASAAEICKSFCPAAKTMLFHGSKIDHAIGPNGTRYADLENAFVYRQKVVDGCTCNGKDPYGLARLDVTEDPTLKAGDIIATTDGLATVRNPKTADYTPIPANSKLSDVKVTPVPPPQKVERVADDVAPRKKRSVQFSR